MKRIDFNKKSRTFDPAFFCYIERVVLDNHNILISSGAQPQGMKRNSKKLSDDAFDNFGLQLYDWSFNPSFWFSNLYCS